MSQMFDTAWAKVLVWVADDCFFVVFVLSKYVSTGPIHVFNKGFLLVSACFEMELVDLGFCVIMVFLVVSGRDFVRLAWGKSSTRQRHGKGSMIGERRRRKYKRVEVTWL